MPLPLHQGFLATSAHPTPTDVMLQQHIQAEVSVAICEALRGRHSPFRKHHPQSLEREQVTLILVYGVLV